MAGERGRPESREKVQLIPEPETHDGEQHHPLDLVGLTRETTAKKAPEAKHAQGKAESIGVAFMDKDGTITLQLRAEGQGAVGDALLIYPKTHKDYARILSHIGDLKPEGYKPVPPWTEESKDTSQEKNSIGVATMDKDGTITLQLRAVGLGMVGDAILTYRKTDEDYPKILSHLGTLKPGQYIPIPPWTEDKTKK